MDDYPSNSIRQPGSAPRAKDDDGEPKKTKEELLERVTTNDVIKRKKSPFTRLKENFTGQDSKSVLDFVFFDVMVPQAKDMIADVVSQGIERKLFGEVRSASRRGPGRGSSSSSYTPYNRFSGNGPGVGRREDPREARPTRRARATHNFDEHVLRTRVEAEEVIDRLFDLVSQFNCASVRDLYDILGVTADFTDEKWGWTDIRGAAFTRVRDGYVLDLPRPIPLD